MWKTLTCVTKWVKTRLSSFFSTFICIFCRSCHNQIQFCHYAKLNTHTRTFFCKEKAEYDQEHDCFHPHLEYFLRSMQEKKNC